MFHSSSDPQRFYLSIYISRRRSYIHKWETNREREREREQQQLIRSRSHSKEELERENSIKATKSK